MQLLLLLLLHLLDDGVNVEKLDLGVRVLRVSSLVPSWGSRGPVVVGLVNLALVWDLLMGERGRVSPVYGK